MSKFSVSLILLLLSASAGAQSILQTQLQTSKTRWSGFASTGYNSNLQQRNSYDYEAQASADLLVNYQLSGANLLRGTLSGYQEQTQGREAKLNDSNLAWLNNGFWRKGEILTIGQQVRAVLPTSKESYRRDEKILGVTLIPSFIVNLTPTGLTGVTLSLQSQLTKNFHKYEQNRVFQGNTSFAAAQVVAVNWSITDALYLQPSFVYGQAWTYSGTKKPDNYQFATELGYSVTSEVVVALGVTNAGAIRRFEQGNDQTIELFNNRTASVYTELTYVF